MLARLLCIVLVLGWIAAGLVWAAEKAPAAITQKDFASMIISELNWADGLPKEPSDRDYLVILGGKRNFNFEAENTHNTLTDNVTVRAFELFGPFNGKGWLMGISETTTAHFTVHIPIGGEFNLKARVKGEGFTWEIGGKRISGGSPFSVFSTVDFGTVSLAPGLLQVTATMPPEGAIDSFTFIAPDHKSIQPFDGWRFKESLTTHRMAEIGVALMNLYGQLPVLANEQVRKISAVDAAQPNKDAAPTDAGFLGHYTSRAWMRANYRGALLEIPVKSAKSGFFIIRARAMGEKLSGSINEVPFSVAGKPYLEMTNFGVFRLEAGDNLIRLQLPSMGGLDVVELTPLDSTPSATCAVVGIPSAPDQQVTSAEALRFINLIREKSSVRK